MFYKILNTQNLIPKTTYDVKCLDESREISHNMSRPNIGC